MVPVLPSNKVRAAIEADDWSSAEALLAQHQEQLVVAVREAGSPLPADGPWLDLLREQNLLLAHLRSARDAAADALARLGADRRGAHAWLRELA